MAMRLLSVSVGRPRLVSGKGQMVSTAIFKAPVEGRVMVRALNLDGDRQADLTVHGGPDKAVYAYPSEHYEFWRAELPELEFSFAAFGENLTTEGLSEAGVNVGDRFRVGAAELQVTQPRMPCYKLGLRFGRSDMVKRFMQSGRTGFYFRVLREGEVGAGDEIELLGRDPRGVAVAEITRLYARDRDDLAAMRRAAEVEALPASWRDYFMERVGKKEAGRGDY
jgi:MOSC domain-containing protein YiiM